MFEGLRDTFDRFTSDVEAEAEDAAVEEGEVGDREATDDGEAPADAKAVTGEGGVIEGESVEGGAIEGDAAESEAGEGETGEGKTANHETASDEPASDEGAGGERGLAERAKLFASGRTVVDQDDLAPYLDDLEMALLGSDVEMDVARDVLDGVESNLVGETRRRLSSTGNLVRDALREALYDVVSVGQFDFEAAIAEADKPVTIVFTGVNGVGKTTTIAKLARYFEERGYSAVLANGDTYRAGANEQLAEHADRLDVPIISHEQGSDPAAVIYDAVEYATANDVDVVLGDTAGRLHTSEGLMDQLSKIDRVIEPDMTLFVDEAVAGKDAVTRAREFDDAAAIDGAILTKADADPQGGAAISIAHVTGKPILFLGVGQGYDDLQRFDPEWVVDQLAGAD